VAIPRREIEYPCSDGHPMTDKDINRLLMEYTEFAIETKFEHDASAYVSANLFVYYVEGDPRKNVSPDVFFVRGVGRGLRDTYLLWKEGRVPEVVFEFVARTSWRMDPEKKRDIYEQMGVPEYYVFDPIGRWLKPRLWAYRLVDGRYEHIPVHEGEITSPILGLRMRVEGSWLRLYDVETGLAMPTPQEMREANEHLREENQRLRRLLEERDKR
jgi:Uma2 family endonuclease